MTESKTTKYEAMSEPELCAYCGSDATRWAAAFIQCTGWEGDHEIMETWFASAMIAMLDANRGLEKKQTETTEVDADIHFANVAHAFLKYIQEANKCVIDGNACRSPRKCGCWLEMEAAINAER